MSSETVAKTVAETRTWASGAAEKIVSHPKVQEALRHPLLQHPALQHPLLADPKVIAIASGLLIILLVLCCEWPLSWLQLTSGTPSSRKSVKKGTPNVIFVGPPASGKTALFSKVRHLRLPGLTFSLLRTRTPPVTPLLFPRSRPWRFRQLTERRKPSHSWMCPATRACVTRSASSSPTAPRSFSSLIL